MSIGKALTFFKRIKTDSEFRKSCYKAESKQALLEAEGFTEYEFEDAVNMNLVKCQDYDEADQVKQLQQWFALL